MSNSIPKGTLATIKLGTDLGFTIKSGGFNVPTQNQNQIFTNLFRGLPQPPTGKIYPALDSKQIQQLQDIGINVGTQKVFVGGLITVPTRSGIPLDLKKTKALLTHSASFLSNQKSFWQTAYQYYETCFIDKTTTNEVAKAQQEIRKQTLIDIAKISLPSRFLCHLAYPNNFFDITGPRLGMYILTLCTETSKNVFL